MKSAILGVVATRRDKLEPLTRWDGDAVDREVGTIGVTIGADKQSFIVVLKDKERIGTHDSFEPANTSVERLLDVRQESARQNC